ncbi:hypothetical protein LINPERHAP2_LOCUS33773 [Linum perenne]
MTVGGRLTRTVLVLIQVAQRRLGD